MLSVGMQSRKRRAKHQENLNGIIHILQNPNDQCSLQPHTLHSPNTGASLLEKEETAKVGPIRPNEELFFAEGVTN